MNRKEYKSNRHRTVGSVEALDDRVLLASAVATPATPPPAPSPINVATIEQFEHRLERLDREFLGHSKQLKSSLIRKSDRLDAMLVSVAKRPQVKAQVVTNGSATTAPAGLVTSTQAVSNQLDRVVGSFSSQLTQLDNAYEQQFGILANPLEKVDQRLGVPANAFENNLQFARAGLTAAVSSTVSAVVASAPSSTTTASNPATSITSPTTTTSSTAATTIGTTSTQIFSNAFTQAFGPSNSATNSVDSELSSIFGVFQNQFQTSVTNLISAISTTPTGAFQPVVGFTNGNGVTFTSTG